MKEVSDHAIFINKPSFNQEADSKNITYVSLFSNDDLIFSNKNRKKWDKPQNLNKVRRKYFIINKEDHHKIIFATKKIIDKFITFEREKSFDLSNKTYHSTHVIISPPIFSSYFSEVALIIMIVIVFSIIVFYFQYNLTSLYYWKHLISYRWSEYGYIFLSYFFFIFIYILFLYCGDNSQKATLLCNTTITYIIVIGSWISLFLGPFLIFRFHIIGDAELMNRNKFTIGLDNNKTHSMKWYPTVLMTSTIIFTVMALSAYALKCKWIYVFIIPIVPIILLLTLDLLNVLKKIIPSQISQLSHRAILPWYRLPFRVFVFKSFLSISIIIVQCGIVSSNQLNTFSFFPFNCSYPFLCMTIGCLWICVGVIIFFKKDFRFFNF